MQCPLSHITLHSRILLSPSTVLTHLFPPCLILNSLPNTQGAHQMVFALYFLTLPSHFSYPLPLSPILFPPVGITCLLQRTTVLLWSKEMKSLHHESYQVLRCQIS